MSRATVGADKAQDPLVMALDVGSSNVRAILFDGQGRMVEGCAVTRPSEPAAGEGSEFDAERLLEIVFDCIDDLLGRSRVFASKIGAVSVCTFVGNILGTDRAGRAVTPLFYYADDRGGRQAERLRASLDPGIYHQRTGCFIHPAYLPVRLAWLADKRPDAFEKAADWISFGEYLERRLFGEAAVSLSVASWTGLLDRRRLAWDTETFEVLPVRPEQFSALTDGDQPRLGLRGAFASRWPRLDHLPWYPAVADGAAANIGSGCVAPDCVALTIGTSSAVRAVVPGTPEHVPDGLWCYRVDAGLSLLGGALTEGGGVFAWLKRVLRLPADEDIDRAVALLPPDGHGLTVLPLLAGERSPGWAGKSVGTIQGLTAATTPEQIVRAFLESIACRIAMVFDSLRPHLAAPARVIASGGALCASAAWQQVVSDALGVPLEISEVPQASARGSALMALKALGVVADYEQAPKPQGRMIEPIGENHEKYKRVIERQDRLYRALARRAAGERAAG
ncbi:MAG TPA: gluconokinase [Myxococcota bacterium]|nr:gluconokinase [Myxococcota bacterium]